MVAASVFDLVIVVDVVKALEHNNKQAAKTIFTCGRVGKLLFIDMKYGYKSRHIESTLFAFRVSDIGLWSSLV